MRICGGISDYLTKFAWFPYFTQTFRVSLTDKRYSVHVTITGYCVSKAVRVTICKQVKQLCGKPVMMQPSTEKASPSKGRGGIVYGKLSGPKGKYTFVKSLNSAVCSVSV